jgi:hypothetical protein
MTRAAVFSGLVVNETDEPVEVRYIGPEAYYVVDDDGFLRHIRSEDVDREVLKLLQDSVLANRETVVEGMLAYLGQSDLFTKAAVEASIGKMDEQMQHLLNTGLPEEARQWLGMMGFRIVINLHGEVLDVNLPGAVEDED